jgi:NAD(P)-dependent dehydrogenase (short-subunit alcohol dehydrogenase family)
VNLSAESLFSVKGKTVVLTGASGFLGRTMGEGLLENGAKVVALGRSDRLESVVTEWQERYGKTAAVPHQVDMFDEQSLESAFDNIAETTPDISVLINNAHELGPRTGFNTPDGTLEKATNEQWERNLAGGVYWPARTTQRIGELMKARAGGSIINISSMYAEVAPNPRLYEGTEFLNPPGYSAAKAALVALTRYVASFWGPYGIRANSILPGPFSNTEEDGPNAVKNNDEFLSRLEERTLLGRLGKPHELVGALLFLASDASSFVTGHALVVDGGWTIS